MAEGYAEQLAAVGLIVSTHAQDAGVEGVELSDHPFFPGTPSGLK